jgi:hypothetical protein
MKKVIISGTIVLILGIVGYFGYLVFQFKGLGECGMSAGPIYGKPISINMEDLKLDQKIVIPNGMLGLMNLSDSLSPKLIKFDVHGKLIWAVEFREELNVDIPHNNLSKMELINDKYGIRLEFFNNSYGEPGVIYLTEDYEIEYMCLSPM